jgi:hypothetical protein
VRSPATKTVDGLGELSCAGFLPVLSSLPPLSVHHILGTRQPPRPSSRRGPLLSGGEALAGPSPSSPPEVPNRAPWDLSLGHADVLVVCGGGSNMADQPAPEKQAGPKRLAFKEAEQHEKAYQIQKGIFVFGKPGQRKSSSKRAIMVSENPTHPPAAFFWCFPAFRWCPMGGIGLICCCGRARGGRRMWGWASRHPRRPRSARTWTRSAPSQVSPLHQPTAASIPP